MYGMFHVTYTTMLVGVLKSTVKAPSYISDRLPRITPRNRYAGCYVPDLHTQYGEFSTVECDSHRSHTKYETIKNMGSKQCHSLDEKRDSFGQNSKPIARSPPFR